MTRKLNRTVLAGGVIYPAGTEATDELEKAITNPAYWDGNPAPTKAKSDDADEDKADDKPRRPRKRAATQDSKEN